DPWPQRRRPGTRGGGLARGTGLAGAGVAADQGHQRVGAAFGEGVVVDLTGGLTITVAIAGVGGGVGGSCGVGGPVVGDAVVEGLGQDGGLFGCQDRRDGGHAVDAFVHAYPAGAGGFLAAQADAIGVVAGDD